MSLNDYTYGTVDGAHRRVAWLNRGRKSFDGSTTPTKDIVEEMLDDKASEIHASLANNGYPITAKTTLDAANPRAGRWLQNLNEMGAACEILMNFPTANDPETAKNPANYYCKRFDEGLKKIDSSFLDKLGMSRDEALSDLLMSGSYKDDDGYEKRPIFKRGGFDYPSSRSLSDNPETEDD